MRRPRRDRRRSPNPYYQPPGQPFSSPHIPQYIPAQPMSAPLPQPQPASRSSMFPFGFGNIGGGWAHYIGVVAPFTAMLAGQQSYFLDTVKLFVLGTIVDFLRRAFQWIMGRFRFQITVTAHFWAGDPAYDWIISFLTAQNIWRRSCEFTVSAKSSMRKWGVNSPGQFSQEGSADYVPTWSIPQLFRWRGYWIEVMKTGGTSTSPGWGGDPAATTGSITLTVYAYRMSALSDLVEAARLQYVQAHKPHVIIHSSDANGGWGSSSWAGSKQKPRRPVSSVVLPEGKMEAIVDDAQDFLQTESWYHELGIPHRRGYLLYGPPGTGKTSTIYSLAGELGLEIWSLSLASCSMDDTGLQNAVNFVPRNSIILIEDIDCAFPSREDEDEEEENSMLFRPPPLNQGPWTPPPVGGWKSAPSRVTMSGLLNVLDGVGSDEGKIFFATTNYVDRLDPALIRPGRIDMRIEYRLANQEQAATLFLRFFTPSRFPNLLASTRPTDAEKASLLAASAKSSTTPSTEVRAYLEDLARDFASSIPEDAFSAAELQGFLLLHKRDPRSATREAADWVAAELAERARREERERARKEKLARLAKARREQLMVGGPGGALGLGHPPPLPMLKPPPPPKVGLAASLATLVPDKDNAATSDAESCESGVLVSREPVAEQRARTPSVSRDASDPATAKP